MTGVLAGRLRDETRAAHDAIEAAVDFESRIADPAAYRRWLERLYGFHRGWEPRVDAALGDPDFFAARRKLHLLADDLVRLGAGDPDALPVYEQPAFPDAAAALGSMYVVEGSTLGGQVIAKSVRQQLGIEPAYHSSYGRAAARMWREFQERLEEVPAERHDAVVAEGARTFDRMRAWLTA